MAGRHHGPDDDNDAAARYLRRLQGDEDGSLPDGVTPGAVPAPPPPPVRPADDEEASPRAFPGAPPVEWSSSLPKGAPFSLVPADTVLPGSSSEGRQVPQLPTWFLSEGLQMLRKSDYRAAEQYYEALTRRAPEEAEGWLGLGAAWQGRGNISQAVTCYVKGVELDEHLFPLAALAVESTPGKPAVLYDVAVALARQDRRRCYRAAISILEEVMASATTSRRLYEKADTARRKAKDELEWHDARDNPALMSLKKTALRQRRWNLVLRGVFAVAALAGLSWLGWHAYHRSRAEACLQRGMISYVQGHKVATYGSAKLGSADNKDAYVLFTEALEQFRASTRFRPNSLEAHFMTVKAGQQVLRHLSAHFGSERTPPDLVQQLHAQIEKAEAACRKLDPTGLERRKQQSQLDNRLNTTQ